VSVSLKIAAMRIWKPDCHVHRKHVTGCETSHSRLRSRPHSVRHTTATERQRVGDEIDAAMIFARAGQTRTALQQF